MESSALLELDAETLSQLDAFLVDAVLDSPKASDDHASLSVVGPTTSPKKPFRKRLPAAERAERRRKQHRELVARGRARAREFVEELRAQEIALQEQLDAIIEGYASLQRRPTAADAHLRPERDEATRRTRLIEAVATIDALSWENQRLEELLEEHAQYQQTVIQAGKGLFTDSQTMAPFELPQENRLLHRRGFWMYFADDDVPFYFEPYAEAKCEELAAHALNNAKRLNETFQKLQRPSVNCFGWNMQHIFDPHSASKLRFHFSKQISTTSSSLLRQDLVRKAWTIINTPELYAKMFSERIVERHLQRVSDHTSFIVRNNPTKIHARSLRSFSIMRAYTDLDALGRTQTYIVLQALRPQDTEAVGLQEAKGITYITTDFSFMSFLEVDDCTLEIVHGGTGGIGEVVEEHHAQCRLVEVTLSWLLWENMVMPQRMLDCQ